MPFNKVARLKVESIDPDAPKLRFDMRPELIGNRAPADPAWRRDLGGARRRGGFRNSSRGTGKKFEEPQEGHFPTIGTIDLRVDYLRPGRGNYFIATGRVVRLGNRVAVAHMELVNDAGELIATGNAAYMLSSA